MVLDGGVVRGLRNTLTFCLWFDSVPAQLQKNNLHKEGTQTVTKLLQIHFTSNFQDPRIFYCHL
jgi:hypothetical protein